jgi:hypothetical protein
MPIQNNPFRQPLLISALALTATAVLHAGNADAILVYEFSQQGADVRLDVSGSLTGLPPSEFGQVSFCFSPFGVAWPSLGVMETGCVINNLGYLAIGPADFGTGDPISFTNYTGTNLFIFAIPQFIGLPDSYVEGDPISGVGLLAGQTLASLGLSSTTPGAVLGTWIVGSDSIEFRIGGGGGGDAVPGPLPLLGAAAAFAHSRRLRTRIRAGATAQA